MKNETKIEALFCLRFEIVDITSCCLISFPWAAIRSLQSCWQRCCTCVLPHENNDLFNYLFLNKLPSKLRSSYHRKHVGQAGTGSQGGQLHPSSPETGPQCGCSSGHNLSGRSRQRASSGGFDEAMLWHWNSKGSWRRPAQVRQGPQQLESEGEPDPDTL
jgi:hypothetical protein